jgi:hypothetical protein
MELNSAVCSLVKKAGPSRGQQQQQHTHLSITTGPQMSTAQHNEHAGMTLVVKTSSVFNVVLNFIICVLYLFVGEPALLHSAINQGTKYMGLATTLCIIPLFVINMYAREVFNNPLVTITSVLLRSFCTIYGTYMTWTLAQHLLRMCQTIYTADPCV